VGDAQWPPIILVDGQRVLVCEPLVSGSSLSMFGRNRSVPSPRIRVS